MSKILVTGANGFIGANILRAALNKRFEVRAFIRKTSDLRTIKDLPVEFSYEDLKDLTYLSRAIDDCDHIIHNGYFNNKILHTINKPFINRHSYFYFLRINQYF